MIDIVKSREVFKKYLDRFDNKNDQSFVFKVTHTYHVAEASKDIATRLHLSEEDILLAELIGLLHDIGRFEELTITQGFNSLKFDHAKYGVKMLFEEGMIREFIDDDQYDEIIKVAIDNHSRFSIEEGLDERALLHAKIIRDSDKLDNFRIRKYEKINAFLPTIASTVEEMEKSLISDKVFETLKQKKCVRIEDRVYPLDYWICVLAFIFDLNFDETLKIIHDNNYINFLIDRFNYVDAKTKEQMEIIRNIINDYIDENINKEDLNG